MIACCLASSSGRRSHFIILIIIEQSVQECDATIFNSCSLIWLKKNHLHILTFSYSVLKLFAGFAIAARIAWKLTVANAMKITMAPGIANICQLKLMRYG